MSCPSHPGLVTVSHQAAVGRPHVGRHGDHGGSAGILLVSSHAERQAAAGWSQNARRPPGDLQVPRPQVRDQTHQHSPAQPLPREVDRRRERRYEVTSSDHWTKGRGGLPVDMQGIENGSKVGKECEERRDRRSQSQVKKRQSIRLVLPYTTNKTCDLWTFVKLSLGSRFGVKASVK